jgi:hypothetical protein
MKSIPSRVLMLVAAAGVTVLLSLVIIGNEGSGGSQSGLPFAGFAGLAVVAASSWWIRGRLSSKDMAAKSRLVCVERIRLAPGKALHLVEVGNESLLVASAENGIQLIAKLEQLSCEEDTGNPGE